MNALTVLSFGGGQDSTAILYRMVFDLEFRAKHVTGDFVAVMADTGNEFPETYDHVKAIEATCAANGVEFHFLTKDKGYHSKSWPDLVSFYERTNTCGSKAFPKTCTDNLKIQVIYRWLSDYVATRYGMNRWGKWKGKQPLVEYAEKFGKIKMLIGIGGDEEKRLGGEAKAKWMRLSIDRAYPLVDLGWDRQGCQDYIKSIGFEVPLPSNCMFCPFISEVELIWLQRNYPEAYAKWVKIEAAKLEANKHKGDKNLGVWGRKTLPQVLAEAKVKYADWSDERLTEYRMSHGHCVMSKY